ncbi:MAG: leucine-rich repeat protein [Lachnospiraceae bacterium]|nr:leucine-rich repeat protein [Lachnospiraceae bacterium]
MKKRDSLKRYMALFLAGILMVNAVPPVNVIAAEADVILSEELAETDTSAWANTSDYSDEDMSAQADSTESDSLDEDVSAQADASEPCSSGEEALAAEESTDAATDVSVETEEETGNSTDITSGDGAENDAENASEDATENGIANTSEDAAESGIANTSEDVTENGTANTSEDAAESGTASISEDTAETGAGDTSENESENPASDSELFIEEIEEVDSPELTVVDISDLEYEDFYYSEYFEDADIRVTLTAEAGIVPADAEVEIQLLEGESLDALEAMLQDKTAEILDWRLSTEGTDPSSIYYRYANLQMSVGQAYGLDFEIICTDEDGELYVFEPAEGDVIYVQIESDEIAAANADEMQEVDLFYISETDEGSSAGGEAAISLDDADDDSVAFDEAELLTGQALIEDNTVSFLAEHFSIYAFGVMVCSAEATSEMIAAEELAWSLLSSYGDLDYYLDDPYRDEMTDAQYAVLEAAAKSAVSGCTTQYEKIQAITEYVSDRIYYDYVYYYNKENTTNETPYDVHVNQTTVCRGYARYAKTLLNSLGIPCAYIVGKNHAYNAAYDSESGRWIFFDTTWCSNNVYTTDATMLYYGYSLTYFDMSVEKIAALTNHEVYYLEGLTDGSGGLYYYLGTDTSDWTDTDLWTISVDGALPDTATAYSVASLGGIAVTDVLPAAFYNTDDILQQLDLSRSTSLTEISSHAFFNDTTIQKVTFPASLTEIAYAAFYGCTALSSADLSGTQVTLIDEFAFGGDTALVSFVFPGTLTEIGDSAFERCSSLTFIDLSGTKVTLIDDYAFSSCTALMTVIFPASLTTIGSYAFPMTALTSLDLSGTAVTEIGNYAFYVCTSLAGAKLPSSLTSVGTAAFYYCPALKSVTFKGSVPSLESNVFSYDTFTAYYPDSNTSWTSSAMQNYGGTVTWKPYGSLSSSSYVISLSASSYTYNGSARKPAVTVKNGSAVLTKGTDYTVSYSNNTNAGTATVKVTGIGNYTSSKTVSFTIKKASQTLTASAASSSIVAGKTTAITASGQGTISYKSGNTSIATVSSSGKVTGKKPGTVKITVTAAGNSNYNSASKTVTVKVTLASGKISSLTNTSNGIKVKWSKITGATGYIVYRKTTSGSWKRVTKITKATTTSYTDTSVKSNNGTKYSYKVVAYYGSTKGSGTAKTTVRLTGTTLSSVKNTSSKKLTVKWKKTTNVTGYQIQYSTSKSFTSGSNTKSLKVKGATKTSETLSGLTKGKTYYVRVRTYKTVNGTTYYSAWSEAKKIKVTR